MPFLCNESTAIAIEIEGIRQRTTLEKLQPKGTSLFMDG